eukprot:sb/3476004/
MTERVMPDEESTKLMQPVTLAMREAVLHLDTHDFGKTRERNREKVGEKKTFKKDVKQGDAKKDGKQGDDDTTVIGRKKRKGQNDVGGSKQKKIKTDNELKLKSVKTSSLGEKRKKKKKSKV